MITITLSGWGLFQYVLCAVFATGVLFVSTLDIITWAKGRIQRGKSMKLTFGAMIAVLLIMIAALTVTDLVIL